MQNHNPNIAPRSQPSHSEIVRRHQRLAFQNYRYLFQNEEESGPEQQRPDKTIRIVTSLVLFFYILGLPSSYVNIYQEKPYVEDIRGSLESMSANLKADPIMDMKIIDKKSACPSGFEPLKLAAWHGTIAGCHCENGDLFDFPCRSDQIQKCKTVPGTFPLDIYEREGKIWCGKRAVLGTDYVKKSECPSWRMLCRRMSDYKSRNCLVRRGTRETEGSVPRIDKGPRRASFDKCSNHP